MPPFNLFRTHERKYNTSRLISVPENGSPLDHSDSHLQTATESPTTSAIANNENETPPSQRRKSSGTASNPTPLAAGSGEASIVRSQEAGETVSHPSAQLTSASVFAPPALAALHMPRNSTYQILARCSVFNPTLFTEVTTQAVEAPALTKDTHYSGLSPPRTTSAVTAKIETPTTATKEASPLHSSALKLDQSCLSSNHHSSSRARKQKKSPRAEKVPQEPSQKSSQVHRGSKPKITTQIPSRSQNTPPSPCDEMDFAPGFQLPNRQMRRQQGYDTGSRSESPASGFGVGERAPPMWPMGSRRGSFRGRGSPQGGFVRGRGRGGRSSWGPGNRPEPSYYQGTFPVRSEGYSRPGEFGEQFTSTVEVGSHGLQYDVFPQNFNYPPAPAGYQMPPTEYFGNWQGTYNEDFFPPQAGPAQSNDEYWGSHNLAPPPLPTQRYPDLHYPIDEQPRIAAAHVPETTRMEPLAGAADPSTSEARSDVSHSVSKSGSPSYSEEQSSEAAGNGMSMDFERQLISISPTAVLRPPPGLVPPPGLTHPSLAMARGAEQATFPAEYGHIGRIIETSRSFYNVPESKSKTNEITESSNQPLIIEDSTNRSSRAEESTSEDAANESEDMRRWKASGGPERLRKLMAGEYENTIEPGQEWNLENPVFDPFGTLPKVKSKSSAQLHDSSLPPNLSIAAQKKAGVNISFTKSAPGAYNNGIWGKGTFKDGQFVPDESGPSLHNVAPTTLRLGDLRKTFEDRANAHADPNPFDHSKVHIKELTQEAKGAIGKAANGIYRERMDTVEGKINAQVQPYPYVIPGSRVSQLSTTELLQRGADQLATYVSDTNINNGEPSGWRYGGTVPKVAIDKTSKSLFSHEGSMGLSPPSLQQPYIPFDLEKLERQAQEFASKKASRSMEQMPGELVRYQGTLNPADYPDIDPRAFEPPNIDLRKGAKAWFTNSERTNESDLRYDPPPFGIIQPPASAKGKNRDNKAQITRTTVEPTEEFEKLSLGPGEPLDGIEVDPDEIKRSKRNGSNMWATADRYFEKKLYLNDPVWLNNQVKVQEDGETSDVRGLVLYKKEGEEVKTD